MSFTLVWSLVRSQRCGSRDGDHGHHQDPRWRAGQLPRLWRRCQREDGAFRRSGLWLVLKLISRELDRYQKPEQIDSPQLECYGNFDQIGAIWEGLRAVELHFSSTTPECPKSTEETLDEDFDTISKQGYVCMGRESFSKLTCSLLCLCLASMHR